MYKSFSNLTLNTPLLNSLIAVPYFDWCAYEVLKILLLKDKCHQAGTAEILELLLPSIILKGRGSLRGDLPSFPGLLVVCIFVFRFTVGSFVFMEQKTSVNIIICALAEGSGGLVIL